MKLTGTRTDIDILQGEASALLALKVIRDNKIKSISNVPRDVLLQQETEKKSFYIKILNAKTGKIKKILTGHRNSVNSLVFSLDGSRLIAGDSIGTVIDWNIELNDKKIIESNDLSNPINKVIISSDGSKIISAGKEINIYDADSYNIIQTINVKLAVRDIKQTEDEMFLVASFVNGKVASFKKNKAGNYVLNKILPIRKSYHFDLINRTNNIIYREQNLIIIYSLLTNRVIKKINDKTSSGLIKSFKNGNGFVVISNLGKAIKVFNLDKHSFVIMKSKSNAIWQANFSVDGKSIKWGEVPKDKLNYSNAAALSKERSSNCFCRSQGRS